MSKKKEGKITLGMLKGKTVTTSVPSISIKFHANAEQLEEFYPSDEDHPGNDTSTGSAGTGEPDSSPLKYLPRLVKRSTSIDITPAAPADASPPSDPWRFFSDIKGKITKSVEEKITEIKARNQEEGSPLKCKAVKDSKENSSLSDSEDFSESSISKTCGIVSTTEGAEMSSDDDTPSLSKDITSPSSTSSVLRHRFRLLSPKSPPREGTVNRRGLAKLYSISSGKVEQDEADEVESAVDALEEEGLDDGAVLKGLEEEFDNIKVDNEKVVNVKEVAGRDVKEMSWHTKRPKTVYAPIGFVDMREPFVSAKRSLLVPSLLLVVFIATYTWIYSYSPFVGGLTLGVAVTLSYYYIKYLLDTPLPLPSGTIRPQDIVKVPAAQEFQPLSKYEGWMNELPDVYNPRTYHITQTQSVYLRLQGNLLRLSHTRAKIPRRALWNEPKITPSFTHHRVYNMVGAKVALLPEGLARKRHWSKKYPICVTLNRDQMDFEPKVEEKLLTNAEEVTPKAKPKRHFVFGKKKKRYPAMAQQFSKLTEENEYELDSENSRASTPSPDSEEMKMVDEATQKLIDEALDDSLQKEEEEQDALCEDDFDTLPEDWAAVTQEEVGSPAQTKLYLFSRTNREKEDWFRRLRAATHRPIQNQTSETDVSIGADTANHNDVEYIKYMTAFHKMSKDCDNFPTAESHWISALIGRILYDCFNDDNFTQTVRDKIQRKLSTIKLPYFIEDLTVTELNLGHSPPLIHKAARPTMDDRGLWIDMDITYEGLIVLILHTKLNLMRLKEPHTHDSSKDHDDHAMFNSDLEDSAESTSDEEPVCVFQNSPVLDPSGVPVQGLGGTSNASKKFIKMVDRIAESKFFQAATDNRYIKKAMEGVSNTDLKLRVEVKEIIGTLVLNIPPPPSDRIWVGFRPVPDLSLVAQPIVGERNITYMRITSWIEKKLLQELNKLMVIPNMEDFIIPVMCPDLPF